MRRLFVLIMVLMLAVVSIQAQDGETLAFGEPVTGTITDSTYEVEYRFTGAADMVVVLRLIPDDAFDGFDEPRIVLMDENRQVMATIDAILTTATLIAVLPDDGEYYAVATRDDGRSGASTGAYTFRLDKVDELLLDNPVTINASTELATYLYLYGSTFDIFYERLSGELYPDISLNTIGDGYIYDSNLDQAAVLRGDNLQRGMLGVNGRETLYIIEVGTPLFYFSYTSERVRFTLTLKE